MSSWSLCSKPNTVPQQWTWRRVSARYGRCGFSWPGQTLQGPSSSSLVWQTWVHSHVLRSLKKYDCMRKESKKEPVTTTEDWFHSPQNFCSEAVCYSEMITRKIERNQLGRDHKNFTVQVKPEWRRANDGNRMWKSRNSFAQKRISFLLKSSIIYMHTSSLHFLVALLLFLLLSPPPPSVSPVLFLLFCSSFAFC